MPVRKDWYWRFYILVTTSIFYANIESAVMNNGFATNWFKTTRGVRQGCPLFPQLLKVGEEMLSNRVRQTIGIKRINLFGNQVKIGQFAADTNQFWAEVISVEHAVSTDSRFSAISGLKLNVKKTKTISSGKWSRNLFTNVSHYSQNG